MSWLKQRWRHILAIVLVVLASLLSFTAIFALWVNRQALTTNNWANTSAKLLENKDIRNQVSLFLTDQIYTRVDVQKQLANVLPGRLSALAGPASAGAKQ